jgi:glutamine synthetase
MFTSPDEVAAYIRDNDVEYVDVRFCDLPGVMQHFTIPASTFGEDTFTEGLGFDGSSIRGFQAINESDMLLLPDANSAFLDPFRKHKTLNVNFFIHDPITREAYSRDPRNVAKKAEAASPTPRTSVRRQSSTSSTRSGTRPASTRPTTTSTRSKVRGTRAP